MELFRILQLNQIGVLETIDPVSENNYKASNKKNLAYQISLEQMKLSSDSLDKEYS